MASLPPLRDILNNTPASATDVEFNFNTIQQHVNTELVNRDGSVQMTGPLILADGSQAISAAQAGSSVPPGVTADYVGTVAPAGWLICDGSVVTATGPNAALAALIGTGTSGRFWDGSTGVGSTQMQLPDFRSRVSVGTGGSAGSIGDRGGSANAVLVSHDHSVAHSHSATVSGSTAHTHSTPNHNHSAQLQHVSWTGRTNSSGPTTLVVGQENVGDTAVQWTGTGIRQNGNSGGGTTGSGSIPNPTVSISTHSQRSSQEGQSSSNANYPPYIVMTKIVKL